MHTYRYIRVRSHFGSIICASRAIKTMSNNICTAICTGCGQSHADKSIMMYSLRGLHPEYCQTAEAVHYAMQSMTSLKNTVLPSVYSDYMWTLTKAPGQYIYPRGPLVLVHNSGSHGKPHTYWWALCCLKCSRSLPQMYHATWDKKTTDACLATFKAIIGYLMSKLGPETEFFAVTPFENSTAPDSPPPPPFVAEHLFSVKPGFQVEVKLGSEWLAASILKIAGPGETIYEGYTLQDGHMLLQFVYQGLKHEAWYDV